MKDYNFKNHLLYLKFNSIIISIKIIIIISFLLLLVLKLQLNKSDSFSNLYKEFKNKDDLRLFKENKTKFYFKVRTRFLKQFNKYYNETNLVI